MRQETITYKGNKIIVLESYGEKKYPLALKDGNKLGKRKQNITYPIYGHDNYSNTFIVGKCNLEMLKIKIDNDNNR